MINGLKGLDKFFFEKIKKAGTSEDEIKTGNGQSQQAAKELLAGFNNDNSDPEIVLTDINLSDDFTEKNDFSKKSESPAINKESAKELKDLQPDAIKKLLESQGLHNLK